MHVKLGEACDGNKTMTTMLNIIFGVQCVLISCYTLKAGFVTLR